MAPKKNKAVAKKTAASTKKAVKAPKPAVAKKTAASTKKAIKATQSNPTDEIIKRYKTAKNPAVEQAATEVLSHKYSNQKRPTNREILAKIKGCKPEEVLNEEIKQVNDLVTNRQKRIEAQGVPFYLQPYNSYCMFMEKVPDKIMDLFQDINQLIGIKASKFRTINDTEEALKQMLFNDELIKIKVGESKEKKNALVLFKEYFATLSDKLLGVLFDDVTSHALFTNTDEEHHQRPHTDYLYPFPRSKKSLDLEEYYFAWTAIVPTNSSGTCLNVWEKPGYPTNIHIKFGEIFYFRSDVIHSGGRLDVHTSKSGPKQLYERLHFYLPTKLQVADPLHVNLTHFDHRTKFDDIYKIPSNPWSAKAKATKKEPNDNEEDKKPNAF